MTIALVIPAAGVGSRMQADRPKQYLPLAGQTILEVTASKLQQALPDSPLYMAISADDPYFPTLAIASRVTRVAGGKERADSVLSALQAIDATLYPWVLVHDAARPLVDAADVKLLIQRCEAAGHGGILATPVRDTMKRSCQTELGPKVDHTVERQGLWHALTPQLFPTELLRQALTAALAANQPVTDEASAMEWAGHPVLLVAGRADNLKVTQPEDLALAQFYLEHR